MSDIKFLNTFETISLFITNNVNYTALLKTYTLINKKKRTINNTLKFVLYIMILFYHTVNYKLFNCMINFCHINKYCFK